MLVPLGQRPNSRRTTWMQRNCLKLGLPCIMALMHKIVYYQHGWVSSLAFVPRAVDAMGLEGRMRRGILRTTRYAVVIQSRSIRRSYGNPFHKPANHVDRPILPKADAAKPKAGARQPRQSGRTAAAKKAAAKPKAKANAKEKASPAPKRSKAT